MSMGDALAWEGFFDSPAPSPTSSLVYVLTLLVDPMYDKMEAEWEVVGVYTDKDAAIREGRLAKNKRDVLQYNVETFTLNAPNEGSF